MNEYFDVPINTIMESLQSTHKNSTEIIYRVKFL